MYAELDLKKTYISEGNEKKEQPTESSRYENATTKMRRDALSSIPGATACIWRVCARSVHVATKHARTERRFKKKEATFTYTQTRRRRRTAVSVTYWVAAELQHIYMNERCKCAAHHYERQLT